MFLIRNFNCDDISILQLILLPQLHFAGDFDNFPPLRFAVGFVRPQNDSRPTKYFAGNNINRDVPYSSASERVGFGGKSKGTIQRNVMPAGLIHI